MISLVCAPSPSVLQTLTKTTARAPSGYHKGKPQGEFKRADKNKQAREWHEGPPRVGTFSMRATRFRLGAGCLSWERKDGTAAKNERILDVIPARFKDPAVNSTRGWRDLNKEEIKRIEKGKMSKPQLGRKAKGAAKADKGKGRAVEESVEEEGVPGDGDEAQFGDADGWMGGSNEQGSDVWPEYNPADFETSMPAPQLHHQNPRGESSRSSAKDVDGNGESASFQQLPPPPRKRARSALDVDSSEGSDDRAQKRVRVTSTAQVQSNTGSTPRITTSRVPRKQQKAAARKTSATQGLSAPANAATGDNIPVHGVYPTLPSNGFDASPPVYYGDLGQPYSAGTSVNAASLMPGFYDPSAQHGYGTSFPQSQLTQDENSSMLLPQTGEPSASYAQSSAAQTYPTNDFLPGFPYFDNAITPDSNVQEFDPGYYPPVSGFRPDGTLDYNSAWNAPLQMSTFDQEPNQYDVPLTQPSEWGYPPQLPPSPGVTGKRKRVHDSVTEQPEGQHGPKRIKRHAANPAVVPEVPYPTDPVIGAYDSPLPAGYAGYETTPPEYKHLDMQGTSLPQPATNFPDSAPNLLSSFDGESWTGEAFPTQGQGSMPLVSDLDGMLAQDFTPRYQDVQDGSGYNSYPNQLADFQSSQWQPGQGDDWYLRWMY